MPFAATLIYLVKSDRERQISYGITYIWNLKNDPNQLIYKTEIDSETRKINLRLLKGNMGVRVER